jgi:CTP:molybdopterin cytidylyltransferase MocA
MAAAALPIVSGGLPGLPSPAVTGEAGTDFLTGLLDAAPQFLQGQQQAMQLKDARQKQAQQALQIVAPQALSNPTDPGVKKSLTQIAKGLGVNPNTFFNPDGSVNTKALAPYDPNAKTFDAILGNPNSSPVAQQYAAQQLGLPNLPTGFGGLNRAQITKLTGDLQTKATKVASGDYPQAQFSQDVAGVADQLSNAGYGAQAQVLQQQYGQPIEISPQGLAKLNHTNAETSSTNVLSGLRKDQASLIKPRIAQINAETKFIQGNTNLLAGKGQLTAAEIQKTLVTTQLAVQNANTAATNAQANMVRAQAAVQNLSVSTARGAVQAATDSNATLRTLLDQQTSLQKTIQSYTANSGTDVSKMMTMPQVDPTTGQPVLGPNGQPKLVPTTLAQAMQTLQKVSQQIQAVRQANQKSGFATKDGSLDTYALYAAALHRNGLPNTMQPNNVPGTNGKKPGATTPANMKPPVPGAQLMKNSKGQFGWKYPDGSIHPAQ